MTMFLLLDSLWGMGRGIFCWMTKSISLAL
jgi:hypothetical protein